MPDRMRRIVAVDRLLRIQRSAGARLALPDRSNDLIVQIK
jgi:hypothetical protein